MSSKSSRVEARKLTAVQAFCLAPSTNCSVPLSARQQDQGDTRLIHDDHRHVGPLVRPGLQGHPGDGEGRFHRDRMSLHGRPRRRGRLARGLGEEIAGDGHDAEGKESHGASSLFGESLLRATARTPHPIPLPDEVGARASTAAPAAPIPLGGEKVPEGRMRGHRPSPADPSPHPSPRRSRGEGDRVLLPPRLSRSAGASTVPFSPPGRRCPKGG